MRRVLLASFFFHYTVVVAWTKTLCGIRYKGTGSLGGGSFGHVDKAVDVKTGQTVAVKFIKTTKYTEHMAFLQEVRAMQHFRDDENFVQLICHLVRFCLCSISFRSNKKLNP